MKQIKALIYHPYPPNHKSYTAKFFLSLLILSASNPLPNPLPQSSVVYCHCGSHLKRKMSLNQDQSNSSNT